MNHRHTLPLTIAAALMLGACSSSTPTPDPEPTEQPTNETADTAPEDSEIIPEGGEEPEPGSPIMATKAEGPYASLGAFVEASGATLLREDPGCTQSDAGWATQGGVVTTSGGVTRHVLLAGKPGALHVLPSDDHFVIDPSLTAPDQLEGRAIIRTSPMPKSYVLFEHIVDHVDATQSGDAHDVLGFSHVCRAHDGGFACARFTTQKGAYLVYDTKGADYEMPNAIVNGVEGTAHSFEVFYMNGGIGMTEPGIYKVEMT